MNDPYQIPKKRRPRRAEPLQADKPVRDDEATKCPVAPDDPHNAPESGDKPEAMLDVEPRKSDSNAEN